MPDNRTYGTIITTAGAALIADCILQGRRLPITQAAAGDGNGTYYQPTVDQVALKREVWRGPIARVEQSALSPQMLDVKIILGDDVGGFTVREMALFDDRGVMIAVCNTPDTEKVTITGGVSGKLTMLMHIVVADTSVLEFSITPAIDVLSMEDMLAHNSAPDAHSNQWHVVATRDRAEGKPTFGLGGGGDDGGINSVALDTSTYTGTADVSAVVSGTEYDANNLSNNGDASPDGTIIFKKTEV